MESSRSSKKRWKCEREREGRRRRTKEESDEHMHRERGLGANSFNGGAQRLALCPACTAVYGRSVPRVVGRYGRSIGDCCASLNISVRGERASLKYVFLLGVDRRRERVDIWHRRRPLYSNLLEIFVNGS